MRDRFWRASRLPEGAMVEQGLRTRSFFAPERRATFATILCSRILSITGWLRLTISASALRSDELSRLIDALGATQPDLFAFGPITRGTFGEMTGAPDILRQIERVVPTLIEPREQMRTNGLKTLAS